MNSKSRKVPAGRRRFGFLAPALFPVPFLLVAALMAAAFWQNDMDFVLGHAREIEAVLVDTGAVHPVRGRPRYSPTFKLTSGEALTLAHPVVASELPVAGATVRLLCSTRIPNNCKTPTAESSLPFYGFASLWAAIAVGTAWLLWRPLLRKR